MFSLRDKAVVCGVGETVYARESEKSQLALTLEASLNAIVDAGLDPKDIDGVIPYGGGIVAEDFITNFGLPDLRYSATTPMGGASPVAALQSAAMAVATGVANHVLIALGRGSISGGRIGKRLAEMPQMRLVSEFEMPIGTNAPAQFYAHMARRHMELYGTTSEHFAEIAMTCRQNAELNDRAMMRKPMTLEDHQASRMIAEPFRLFDCSLESAGAAAVGRALCQVPWTKTTWPTSSRRPRSQLREPKEARSSTNCCQMKPETIQSWRWFPIPSAPSKHT